MASPPSRATGERPNSFGWRRRGARSPSYTAPKSWDNSRPRPPGPPSAADNKRSAPADKVSTLLAAPLDEADLCCAYAALAGRLVAPGVRRGHAQIRDRPAVLRAPDLGVAAEIADQDHLVHATGHVAY